MNLQVGDRILAIDDIDLSTATHQQAVNIIRKAGKTISVLVESFKEASAKVYFCWWKNFHFDFHSYESQRVGLSVYKYDLYLSGFFYFVVCASGLKVGEEMN